MARQCYEQLLDMVCALDIAGVSRMQQALKRSSVLIDTLSSPSRIRDFQHDIDLGVCVVMRSPHDITFNFCPLPKPHATMKYLACVGIRYGAPPALQNDRLEQLKNKHPTLDTNGLFLDPEIHYNMQNADGIAIDEYDFVVINADMFSRGDEPDDAVCVIARVPFEEFLLYEGHDMSLQQLRDAMTTFHDAKFDPAQTLNFNIYLYDILFSHVTACYVQKVIIEAEFALPLDFLLWYFQNAKSIAITTDLDQYDQMSSYGRIMAPQGYRARAHHTRARRT